MRRRFVFSSVLGLGLAALGVAWLWGSGAAPRLVRDDAGLMTVAERDRVARFHGFLLGDHDIDYRVVTVSDAGDVNRFAVERFGDLRVGGLSRTGRGLLLVIDTGRDLVRLEVSQALEGAYPDAFVAYVEQRQMVPFFRGGRVADGILATTELIVTRAQRAQASAGFDGEPWVAGTGGAGATARARLGEGAEKPAGANGAAAPAGETPGETLARYFRAMRERTADPGLAIYTPATRRMLKGWVVTRAQMDSVVRTYRECHAEPVRFDRDGRHAVIRYPVAERRCSPWFFEKVEGRWALDLTMMQRAVRFGRDNSWRLDRGVEHPYEFAFQDWRFDRHGFPVARR